MAESKGFFRHTAVCLRVALLLELVGENSPPDCFLPQTSSAPSLFESLFFFQSKKQVLQPAFVMAKNPNFNRNYFKGVQLKVGGGAFSF